MSHGTKKPREIEQEQLAVGFQIAPMIDVVFVIMLFFMVMVGSVKVERELKSQLPGLAPPSADAPQEMPDEIIVGVEETGAVTLNEGDDRMVGNGQLTVGNGDTAGCGGAHGV